MKLYGLTGYPLGHSFSPDYFADKFKREEITDAEYRLFPLKYISEIPSLLGIPELRGLNVTIPHKESVIPYLDSLDAEAAATGAVNCISFYEEGKRKISVGHNTDIKGFSESIRPILKDRHTKALLFGSGGAAKAVHYAFSKLGIEAVSVSRNGTRPGMYSYREIDAEIIRSFPVLVNCTPCGTANYGCDFPCASLPRLLMENLTSNHLLFDLVYNPALTPFLALGVTKGATVRNGLEMLHIQADSSWLIWNKDENQTHHQP